MRFRKKPVVVEAMQFNDNALDIMDWAHKDMHALQNSVVSPSYFDGQSFLNIRTLEGDMAASPGDWIIKGVNGEFYPCKPDIFEKTYERVEDV